MRNVTRRRKGPSPLEPTLSLTDRLTETLSAEILGGTYELGELMPSEGDMAATFGVSRTVVREAVSRLKAEGLLASRQGLGLIVKSVKRPSLFQVDMADLKNTAQLLSMIELRMSIETEAAGLAAIRRTQSDLDTMQHTLDAMIAATENNDIEAGVSADVQFHHAIGEATQNPHFVNFFRFLDKVFRENITLSRQSSMATSRSAAAQNEHTAIFEMIKSGDADGARGAARIHIENTAKRFVGCSAELPAR